MSWPLNPWFRRKSMKRFAKKSETYVVESTDRERSVSLGWSYCGETQSTPLLGHGDQWNTADVSTIHQVSNENVIYAVCKLQGSTRFDRVASADYQLGKYHIPKGSIVSVPVYPLHHDAEVWPDPEKFIPERSCWRCSLDSNSTESLCQIFVNGKSQATSNGLSSIWRRTSVSNEDWETILLFCWVVGIVLECGLLCSKRSWRSSKHCVWLKYRDAKRPK